DIHNAGDHGSSLEGIFVINGENIKRKYKTKARIYDIIPTLMHILNVPITEDIDGKVLEDIFIDDKRKVSRSKKENVSSLIDHAFDALTKNDKN
ncbi:hypothetical protein M1615_04005, partial [Patescibacteria group bacterium]|nr:hypothetical protein [Patescibacteria group bacterium]